MLRCPCTTCEKKGCGPYHDKCKEYQEYSNDRKENRKDINRRKEFTRHEKRLSKNHGDWAHQKNVGY